MCKLKRKKILTNISKEEIMNDKQRIQWLTNFYSQNSHAIDQINLIGFRNSKDQELDVINDMLGFWTADMIFLCAGTTEPGVYWVKDTAKRNKQGTFHLMEGFHDSIWSVGTHKGYEALVNDYRYCKPTKGWRDANYNFVKDNKDIIVCDYFGINFHRMHPISIVDKIGKYSGGCQVVQDPKRFAEILATVKASNKYMKNKNATFNYMLFNISQLPEGFLV